MMKFSRMNAFEIIAGNSPFITAAIHDGHYVREEVRDFLNLLAHERMREEDPYTDYLAEVAESRIIGRRSRFEVDMNRPREKAIYRKPEDAWGLNVWSKVLPKQIIERSLKLYDEFYMALEDLLLSKIARLGYFVVLDLHSYNYRRDPNNELTIPLNPEINVGTLSLSARWKAVKDAFISRLREIDVKDHKLDVRENINFKGGEFSTWINRHFGDHGFSLAIEFKKVFMDEWTGRVDIHHLNSLRSALVKALPTLKSGVQRLTA